ncbi:6-phosphofructokinase [Leucobacter sp. CSA1]|uniref:6-phosphofructokinase n=1 Tax=Leucobacter chromiisoli TaxID=2796471 RepID=A0A934QA97_9MICO|nr:6-phosphofructokinase [Leucobacter chromiisoli]MBK0419407.1 6-phosphofructokinase [Leucobacter chromiisoli]
MALVLAQTGAPTAVVNRSVRGFLTGARERRVLLGHGGPDALVTGTLVPELPHDGDLDAAGSYLGSGRRAIASADLDRIVDRLAEHGATGLSLIGGNGTMAFLHAIDERASLRGYGLRVVGIPKTIDNDLEGIDHSPGFASAARYLASTVTDMVRDHVAMAGIEKVRIVETMGRDTGWLGLAASYHLHDPRYAADLVLIPERAFSLDAFIADVSARLSERGRAFVVVSEGVAPELTDSPVKSQNHTRLIQGGVSRVLAREVSERLGVTARGEVIGTAQRCSSALVSERDQREAEELGRIAARWLGDPAGPSGVMASLTSEGAPRAVPLREVAGRVRHVPERWRRSDPRSLDGFQEWLTPLVELV